MSFTVSDLDTSVNFYNKVLGLGIINISERSKEFAEKATGIKDAHLKIAYLNGGNCSIELIQYIHPRGERIDIRTCDVGSAHICFNAENFNGIVKKLKENKVRFVGNPLKIPAGPNKGRQMVYVKDPDSNILEIIEIN